MDFLGAKAMTIAVGIAISLTITSAILFTLSQITLVYKEVYNTDVSIRKQFVEFAMYDETVMTGLEMYNTAKRFKNSPRINVRSNIFGSNNINTDVWVNSYSSTNANYNNRIYDVTFSTDSTGITTIIFRGR